MPDPHRLGIRVYYEDTDFSGAVYHASYLRFFERGRTEFLRRFEITQVDMRDEVTGLPMGFVVRRMTIDFLSPARMDDLLTVKTMILEVGGASLAMAQTILREEQLLVRAEVQVALVSNSRPQRLPLALRNRLLGGS